MLKKLLTAQRTLLLAFDCLCLCQQVMKSVKVNTLTRGKKTLLHRYDDQNYVLSLILKITVCSSFILIYEGSQVDHVKQL